MKFSYQFSDIFYSHNDNILLGEKTSTHSHSIYEMICITEGSLEIAIGNECYTVTKGNLIMIQPGSEHAILRCTADYDSYLIRFTEYLAPSELLSILQNLPQVISLDDDKISNLFHRFDEHVEYVGDEKETIKMLFRCVLTEIIVYLCRKQGSFVVATGLHKNNMTAVIEFIKKNLDKPLKLKDICEEFHYSKSYLCHEFTEIVGISIMQYIRIKRIEYADALIRSGMSPTEACENSGFSDYSSFFRCYTKIIGHPPSGKSKKNNIE